ncbi:MAG TPA: peptide chain release factor 2 [Acidimicrobiales bacterium]|nr:peptide chain release factor 2 [Acidimicrobiales bacterium]
MARASDPPGTGEQRDLKAELLALRSRLEEAQGYLRLDHLRQRRAELEKEVSRPDLWDDPDTARRLSSEFGSVGDDIELLEDLGRRLSDAEVLFQLMVEEGDDSVATELTTLIDDLARRLDDLELRSLFTGEYDENDAIAELHSGAGGTDAQDWCEMLLRMYQRWAERRGFAVELDEATAGQEAGLLSATFIVKGRFAYGLLSAERGVHRLVRMSPFDSQHRRQTSFASLDVTPFLEDLSDEVAIDDKDLRIDTYRSSGAGGQHVNKTDSAVRLTHLPTGLVVSVQNERSQHQNKAKAMQILGAKLAERQRAERRSELDSLSGPQSDVAWGSQIRSYVMAPYQLVKDLRTQLETGNVDAVLDGDIDAFIESELRRLRTAGGGNGSTAPTGGTDPGRPTDDV